MWNPETPEKHRARRLQESQAKSARIGAVCSVIAIGISVCALVVSIIALLRT